MKISPSQLKSAKCLRKWAAEKLGGFYSPSGSAARLGTAAHKELELYLQSGRSPDLTCKAGRLAQEALPFVPKPGRCEPESRFTIPMPLHPGVYANGIMDFWVPPAMGDVLLGDLKTTSNPEAYGLTTDTMLEDEQGIVYPLVKFEQYPLLEEIPLRWVYVRTQKSQDPDAKPAYPVEAVATRKDTYEAFGDIIRPRLTSMVAIRAAFEGNISLDKITRLNVIPNDPKVCGAIGTWCAFYEHCDMFNQNNDVQPMQTEPSKRAGAKKMSTSLVQKKLEELKAKKAGSAAPVPPEADKALEETAKEIAGEQAADPDVQRAEAKKGTKRVDVVAELRKLEKTAADLGFTIIGFTPRHK